MRRTPFLSVILLVAFAAPAAPAAADGELDTIAGAAAPGEYDQGFGGSVALGYTETSGNAETSNLDARVGVTYGSEHWYHALSAEKIRATESGDVSANSLQAEGQSDYLFTPNNYIFARVGYSTNDFSGIEQRTSETIGYGRRLLHTPTMTWSAQVGAGARQEHIQGEGSRNSAVVQLATSFSWQFTENSSLGQGIVVERGDESTRTESATTLTLKVIDNFSLVVAYTIKHNSHVPPETENTDTYTSVSLQYIF